MNGQLKERHRREILKRTESVLDRWQFAASAEGSLWIRPSGPDLSEDDLGGFLRLLRDVCLDSPPDEIIFDLEHVDYIGPRWTVVMAMLLEFAEGLEARCLIASAHGQPAAVAEFYSRNRKIAEMICHEQDRGLKRQSA